MDRSTSISHSVTICECVGSVSSAADACGEDYDEEPYFAEKGAMFQGERPREQHHRSCRAPRVFEL